MACYIAFLRAINVGGHTVKMQLLRELFDALDFSNVETFIASGNVIFESKATSSATLEKKIEKHLLQSLGYEVKIFIRKPSEIAKIAGRKPFRATNSEGSLYIAFLPAEPNKDTKQKIKDLCSEDDDFKIYGRELYWLCRTTLSQSKISGARLEKALGMPMTMRNITTINKLAAKYPAAK